MPDVRSEIEAAINASPADSQPATETATPVDSSASATPATQGATTQPQSSDDSDDGSTLPSDGAIPVSRVQKIIQNARKKAAAEVEGRFSWAKDVKPEQYNEHRQILTWLDSDPVGFHKFLDSQLKSNPQYAPAFQSAAQPQQTDPEPQPDVQLTDGSLTYSRDQFGKLFAWRERQVEERIAARFGPIEQAFKQQAAQYAGLSKAQAVLSEAKTWPAFSENMQEIRQLMTEDKRVTLESAYRRVVVPKMQQADKDRKDALRQEILQELKLRPAASTETGRSGSSAPKSYKGMSTEDVMRALITDA